jgi:hypothetical protein
MRELIQKLTLAALVLVILVVLGAVWARTHPGWLDRIVSSGPTIIHYDCFALFTVRGTVVDESTAEPVPGADVFFYLARSAPAPPGAIPGRLVGSSGVDGVVALEFSYAWGGTYEKGKDAPPDSFRLTVRAKGYRDFVHEFEGPLNRDADGSPIRLEFGRALLSR